ncbi:hypothetical protein ANO11243_056070 [Dothideomycetidae sp. 11243]|nr:hypothetical protein ANO11243_056070 [fungal sp. No.11243]
MLWPESTTKADSICRTTLGLPKPPFGRPFLENLAKDIVSLLENRLGLVEVAVALGMLFEAFFHDDNGVLSSEYNPVIVRALKKFLTYRIPLLRKVNEPPYAVDEQHLDQSSSYRIINSSITGTMTETYTQSFEIPSIADYCRLRSIAGLTPRSETAAAAGLPRTIVGVVIKQSDHVVGMGRVVGDGLFYQVVDIAVDPDHQGRGLGKKILSSLMRRLEEVAPAEAHVSLLADGQAHKLYAQYGFAPTAPISIGLHTQEPETMIESQTRFELESLSQNSSNNETQS